MDDRRRGVDDEVSEQRPDQSGHGGSPAGGGQPDRAGERSGATAGTSQGDALQPLFGQDADIIGGHVDPDRATPIAGPGDRTDVGPLHGGGQDPATGGSDLGPTAGGGDG